MFYEIFDYLDGYDIYQAFSNLNIHFENDIANFSNHYFPIVQFSVSDTLLTKNNY
jgi:hypothetical protein